MRGSLHIDLKNKKIHSFLKTYTTKLNKSLKNNFECKNK